MNFGYIIENINGDDLNFVENSFNFFKEMYKVFFNKSNLRVTFILDPFVCVCILYNLLRLEREFHIQTFTCKSLISNCKKNFLNMFMKGMKLMLNQYIIALKVKND